MHRRCCTWKSTSPGVIVNSVPSLVLIILHARAFRQSAAALHHHWPLPLHSTCPLQGMRRASPAPAALERDHELHAGTAVPVVLQAYGKLGENDLDWRRSLLHKLLALRRQRSTVSRVRTACTEYLIVWCTARTKEACHALKRRRTLAYFLRSKPFMMNCLMCVSPFPSAHSCMYGKDSGCLELSVAMAREERASGSTSAERRVRRACTPARRRSQRSQRRS